MKTYITANSQNYEPSDIGKEHNKGNSETVQNDSYSIKQLLEKSQTGNVPPIKRVGQYHDDPTHDTDTRIDEPDFDLADAQIIKDEIEDKIKNQKKEEAKEAKLKSDTPKKADEVQENEAKPKLSDAPEDNGAKGASKT